MLSTRRRRLPLVIAWLASAGAPAKMHATRAGACRGLWWQCVTWRLFRNGVLMQWFCCLVLQQQLLARFVLRARSLLLSGAPLRDSPFGTIESLCNQLVRSYTAHSCNAVTMVCERLCPRGMSRNRPSHQVRWIDLSQQWGRVGAVEFAFFLHNVHRGARHSHPQLYRSHPWMRSSSASPTQYAFVVWSA